MASGGYAFPAPEWRRPPDDGAVQCTHIDAALAKASCARLGYFQDPYTEQLIRVNRSSGSPLIHRGYWSRVEAIRQTVLRFVQEAPAGGVQVVNLGAGFDTLYFWLREDAGRWRDDLFYFEVDFPEVLSKKISAISRRQNLWPMLDVSTMEELTTRSSLGLREIRTKHCRMVQADMRISSELTAAMEGCGLRPDLPTIFVAECVLVYMQALHGDGIIQWAASAVTAPSAMVMYEQTNPHDRFGKVMVKNLAERGCPLLSVYDYPSMEAQKERFLARGWTRCQVADMNEIYRSHLDQSEVERIHKLELMDEFEECLGGDCKDRKVTAAVGGCYAGTLKRDQSFRYPGDGCDAGPTSGAARTAAQEVAGGPGVWGVSMEEPIRPREHPFDDWTKSRPSGRVSRLRRIDLALRGLDFQATQRQDEDGEAI
ncbi:unnamed protein product [Cladocopium goreaui]|uniref:[phosphatase 2A protein]-leucine-carboxy methyltransferase n=1 Tax=Cladocopium goreaui TaxID=2562237 RepID=A0A9P1G514_9DINO|nr:unnamed protein product [Cladocopium goreaui]